MKASVERPIYTAKVVHESGSTATTYHLKDITTDLLVSHPKNMLAEKVDISLINTKVEKTQLRSIIAVKDKIYVYANTGSGSSEVFRGIVWERTLSEDSDSDEIKLSCYDRLIYLHKSRDNFFAKSGKKTKALIESIAKKWGFKISFKYSSITHGKLTFHNENVADIIISILEEVKKKTGISYIIRMEKDTIVIDAVGSNTKAYQLTSKTNTISTNFNETMEDMVTKVLIVKAETTKKGKSEEETGKYLTVASVTKNTDKYGTLQQIITLGKDDSLADAKKEANQTLKDNAVPKKEIDVKSVDIPWVKKGDQIYISAGSLSGYYIVDGIEHDALNYLMRMEISKYG